VVDHTEKYIAPLPTCGRGARSSGGVGKSARGNEGVGKNSENFLHPQRHRSLRIRTRFDDDSVLFQFAD
jgi:hypothetical protein